MISSTSQADRYKTLFSNGRISAAADTTPDKGGGNQGLRPHELLEAALGCCMNMHLRMYADNHGIALGEVTTTVAVDRSDPARAVFDYSIQFADTLPPEVESKLRQVATTCPVHNTLSRQIVIRQGDA